MHKLTTGLFLLCIFPLRLIASEGEEQPIPSTWVDSAHSYTYESVDRLAGWMDSFFGVPRADLESAYSSLRINVENEWEEGNGTDEKIKLRGKVHLPRLNKRLSLVFTDENDEELDIDSGVSSINDDNDNTKVGLQYNLREKSNSRVDFGVGLKSSVKGKANVRYRYDLPWGDKYLNRFTETLYFVDTEGFGLRSRYELDRKLDDDRLVRWSNNARFAEEIDGVHWVTRLTLAERLSKKEALSRYVWIAGETRPEYLTTAYGLGMRYRRNIYRPWLFMELEPAYAWKRKKYEDRREGVVLFTLRFEVLIERLR
ncbi:hypothetical protein [Oceanicoccus sagamiensis]|uniref:Uncharacterized protein n=1 Tax=Oceanicoccus sagamiensis TaxID=716816 RepID=A0A1X9NC33_9GAMM|nr:hypothetical protein [Oceanicoccus sagamiensis]ARN74604.1 hypothetical protein BST96_11005 [Oceanicoccus sagamiensis]